MENQTAHENSLLLGSSPRAVDLDIVPSSTVRARLVQAIPHLSGSLVVLIICASVLTNQPAPEAIFAGRVCHFLSILASCALICCVRIRPALAFLCVTAAAYAFGDPARTAYEFLLLALMFAAGAAMRRLAPPEITRSVIIWTVLASALLMLLQVVGIGEWTQALTTQGKITETNWTTKIPSWTFLVPADQLNASPLQGRPAGFLYSNQFASMVVLLAIALYNATGTPRNYWIEFGLCCAAVLTLSKVVFVGLVSILVFRAIFGGGEGRSRFLRMGALAGLALLIYALAFPGLVQTYFLSWPLLWQSIAVRLAGLGSDLGISNGSITSYLLDESLNFGLYEDGSISKTTLLGIASTANEPALGAFAQIILLKEYLLGLMALLAILIALHKPARRTALLVARHTEYPLLLALLVFSLSANFLSAPIFWLMVGVAVPIFGARTPQFDGVTV
ncbi:hypothetical protein [Devosia sp. UYZn731]|uniref:hypothetical protein n=1 Tax=Devosia sp. UYZn731 TaxID=3156345 RepID=UPI0033950E9B